MSISRFVPPLDYLRAASPASLQSFELSRLNHAANLRREIAALIDQWVEETAEAILARWMLDHHQSIHGLRPAEADIVSAFPGPAIDPLPDSPAPPVDLVCPQPRFSDAQPPLSGSIGRKSRKQKRAVAD